MFRFLLRLPVLMLAACSISLAAPDGPSAGEVATLQGNWVAEATALRDSVRAERTMVAATVAVLNTETVRLNEQNRLLYATVAPGNTQEPGIELGILGADSSGMSDVSGSGAARYTVYGTTAAIRTSDGCPTQLQSRFPVSTTRIYVSLLGEALRPGTTLEARWYRGEDLFETSRWQTDTIAERLCIWFYIENGDPPFTRGEWWVQLSADGLSLAPALGFVLE